MVSFKFSTLSNYLALVILCATAGEAVPFGHRHTVRHATHRTKHASRGINVDAYHPPTTFKTFGTGLEQKALFAANPDVKSASRAFVASQLKVDESQMTYNSGYTTAEGTSFAYLKQTHDGVTFANSVCNVVMKDGSVMAWGHSFVDSKNIAPSTPTVPVKTAIAAAEKAFDAKYNDHPPSVEYLVKSDGSVALTHVVQLRADDSWVEAFVDAHTSEVLSVTDFAAHATTYRAVPPPKQNVRDGLELIKDPEDFRSSPFGWHSVDGQTNFTTTQGNNVIAFKGSQQNLARASAVNAASNSLTFDYTYDDSLDPTNAENLNAARVNGFFIANQFHDITYLYGFTEDAFNFQQNNNGKGGVGNDRVQMSIQDASGSNNAAFFTPPDGQSGQCQMFIFDLTDPRRDGVMENPIPIHELTHGVSNRLTGGGTGRCLQTLEAGGMGEGWSDAMADWMSQTSATTADFVVGSYVSDKAEGLRTAPYSTDPKVNSLTYASIAQLQEVHQIGEVWANMLHNVYAALVDKFGFSATARTDPTGKEGNVVFLHLFMDSLAIQPCNPTLVDARDAYIQADKVRFNGANRCLLFQVFASRGLGANAKKSVFVDDFTVPADC